MLVSQTLNLFNKMSISTYHIKIYYIKYLSTKVPRILDPFLNVSIPAGEGRWMMGTEALIAQGFPIHPSIHAGLQLCCFGVPPLNPPRRARVVRVQAGNSMHLFVISVQFLYLLAHAPVKA